MQPYVERLDELGIAASVLRLPKGDVMRAMKSLRDQVGGDLPTDVIGGHSFGGRVASMVAAETKPAGLVLLSYPLHRPGHPEELRTEHWSRITCPVLVLAGDRDQFARIDLLRQSVKLLPHARLHICSGLRHGLLAVADDVAKRIAAFASALTSSSVGARH
jgi:predicted alpha/beta-hydrolase family hydrolase